ncbi:hypothetical protein GCM10023084_03160 [Streptomyces lacrimifluminis]|uniref:hypothetical protein n=1 Tax=Streptomyces lacrimifluminis TaxID=1500077 RepID=UPI0031E919C6
MSEAQPGRYEPPDEDVDDKRCARTTPHEDHYWRLSTGRPARVLNRDAVYCSGIKPSAGPVRPDEEPTQ